MESKERKLSLGVVLPVMFLLTPVVFFLENITLRFLIVALQFGLLGLALYLLHHEKNIRKMVLQVIVVIAVLTGFAFYIFNKVVSGVLH